MEPLHPAQTALNHEIASAKQTLRYLEKLISAAYLVTEPVDREQWDRLGEETILQLAHLRQWRRLHYPLSVLSEAAHQAGMGQTRKAMYRLFPEITRGLQQGWDQEQNTFREFCTELSSICRIPSINFPKDVAFDSDEARSIINRQVPLDRVANRAIMGGIIDAAWVGRLVLWAQCDTPPSPEQLFYPIQALALAGDATSVKLLMERFPLPLLHQVALAIIVICQPTLRGWPSSQNAQHCADERATCDRLLSGILLSISSDYGSNPNQIAEGFSRHQLPVRALYARACGFKLAKSACAIRLMCPEAL